MPEDRRKVYTKKGTGTVPKVKHHNNTSRLNQDDHHNVVANNLGRVNQPNFQRFFGGSGRNLQSTHCFTMESLVDELNSLPTQNGSLLATNGSASTTNTSESASRRNSVGTVPKCDNVSKYPDKKQIEDKLNQIREYLHITSSLMSNVKNAEDQSTDPGEYERLEKTCSDLKDSEAKLVAMLTDIDDYDKSVAEDVQNIERTENGVDNLSESSASRHPKNVLEKKVEHANMQLQMLRDQENLLLNLQLKAENQLRQARHAQQKLVVHQNTNLRNMEEALSEALVNEYGDGSYAGSKNLNENHEAIKELEDRLKTLKTELPSSSRQSASNIQEHFQAQVDCLQQKINQLRDANDNRNQLIQILDNRDTKLHSEHTDLQNKLKELQSKKLQVDQLVSQLQNLNEESDEEDVGVQVRKLVSMKQQLSKLKDMLEIVKGTEGAFESQNVNESDTENQENTNSLSAKADNLIQNDVRSNQLVNCSENVSNARQENNPSRSTNERRVKEKQVNKKSMNANERERLKLQAELQAKKSELEELMCKHKAASSNLNQDVHCENKSDVGAASNSLYEDTTNSWWPVSANLYHLPNSSERYSSDDCPEDDMNEYSELNSSGDASNIHLLHPMPALNYQAANYIKHKDTKPRLEVPADSYARAPSGSPERSVHSASVSTSVFQRERGRSNSEQDTQNKTQVQKQLELIRSVCDSILEQQNSNIANQTANAQNLRNNLTPSPLYTEPRQFSSPNPHAMNALNVINSAPDSAWLPPTFNPQNVPLNDASNYQNWLATNTLQTQAFMLNTLNQCCQMLWLQQRELAALRTTVSSLQDRLQASPFESSYLNSNPCLYPTMAPQDSRRNSQVRTLNNPKVNQVSSAASLPNLNYPHVPQTNSEPAYASQNNTHNARVLESGLNNTIHSHQNTAGDHVNNTVLHPLPSQIWNGQALNNQVAPGNRANNYWDNFRSYSRQNLLSTKSNEILQNPTSSTDRSNNSSERSQNQPFPFLPLAVQKQNTEHQDSINSSVENTPRRRTLFKSPRHTVNTDPMPTIPPDVLNINEVHSTAPKTNDLLEIPLALLNQNAYAGDSNFHPPFLNAFGHTEPSAGNSNLPDGHACKDCPSNQRNRNEWHDDVQTNNNLPKSKLFDELRENVYKEVASLISANQGRPHFLIQLFRDLQLISSDPMRRRTLQSIQALISHSLSQPGVIQTAVRQTSNAPSAGMDNDMLVNCPSYFDIHPNLWHHARSSNIDNDNSLESECPDHMSEVLTFLSTHSEDIFQQNLLESLKELLVESTFSTLSLDGNSRSGIIQKHFANLVTETLDQYRGKRVQDVSMNVLQTIEDLLLGEISLIRLMKDNMTENGDLNSLMSNEAVVPQQASGVPFELQTQLAADKSSNPPQIQNGDLAEADQSRLELEDEEEEGAVGGVLGVLAERSGSSMAGQISQDEIDLPKIDFAIATEPNVEFTEQGLDQVPTRLTTHSRSRTNTPSRDHSNSSRTDTSEQF